MGKASVLRRTPLRNSSTGVYDVQLEEADAVDAAVMEAGAGNDGRCGIIGLGRLSVVGE